MHSKRIAFCLKNFSLSLSLSEVEHSIRFKQSFFHFSLAFSHLLLWGALSIPCKDHRPVSPCYHIWWWETEPLWDGLSWLLQSRCLRWFIIIVNVLLGIRYFFTHRAFFPIILRVIQLVNMIVNALLGIRYFFHPWCPRPHLSESHTVS